MGESTLRWPTDKEREEKEEVCSIGEEPHAEKSISYRVTLLGPQIASHISAVISMHSSERSSPEIQDWTYTDKDAVLQCSCHLCRLIRLRDMDSPESWPTAIRGVPHELLAADPANPLVSLCYERLGHQPNGQRRTGNPNSLEATLFSARFRPS